MKMAGVKAHAQPRFLFRQSIKDIGNLLKGAAHVVPGPGAVLQEQHCNAPAAIKSSLKSRDYPLLAPLLSSSKMASQMGYQIVEAQHAASFQLCSQSLYGFVVNFIS